MKRPIVVIGIISALASLAVVGAAWWVLRQDERPMPVLNQGTAIVAAGADQPAKASFTVSVANTPAEQSRGLSGVTSLSDDEGMYFPLDPAISTSFWMKDMFMPIDIIWIVDGRIVQIDAEVPAPSDEDNKAGRLETYSYLPGQVTAVLEIKAGRSAELGLVVGDEVSLMTEAKMTE